ncbi:MAG: 23S rRNA (guanosine(2251)-2'-O)-methyltransferase RlmB [Cellulosilyticaceae bacterium]
MDNKQQSTEQNTRTEKPKNYKPRQYKPRTDKPKFDKAQGNKPHYDRNNEDKDKVQNNKPRYDKNNEGKSAADKPRYNKSKSNRPKPQRRQDDMVEVVEDVAVNESLVFGRNAVIEVLKSGRDIDKIIIQKGQTEGSIKKIIGDAKAKGVVLVEAEKAKLDELTANDKHQGVVAYVSAHKYSDIDEILNDAKSKGEDPFILILDNIQDPHNLGAIIRTAHTAGVHGIIIAKRRAVGLTATVAKASAGAIEYMKVAKVTNIAQTIEDLKQKGIWVACADMDGEIIYKDNLRGAIGIVIGSEGEGISQLVRNKCDFAVSIPMYGKVTSLNASVAASILVYEVVRQRHF